MKASYKIAIIVSVAIILGGAAIIGGIYEFTGIHVPNRDLLEGKPEYQAAYDKALVYEAKIKENPQEVVNYSVVGSEWKMIADTMHDKVWYELSLRAYERGIAVTNQTNSLLLTNAGQIAEELGDFEKARNYYLIAIDLSPGDANYHLMLIKLIKNKFHAPEQEILRAYDNAMARVVGGADLVSSRLQYLKSVGRTADARADLELLYTNKIITTAQYNDEIAEIVQLEALHK